MSETDQVDDLHQEIASQVAETPAVEKVETPVVDNTDPTGLRATLKKAMADTAAKQAEVKTPEAKPVEVKHTEDGRVRGPDGKFLPKDAAPQKVEQPKVDVKPSEGAQPGADQVKKPDAAPGTWRAEAKAKWDSLDPLIKSEVLKREEERTKEVAKFQQQISQINNAYGPIEKLIGPRRALWRAQFGNETQALERLFNVSDLASQSPNDFLAYYLSQPDVAAKVDLQKVFGQQAPTDDFNSHPVVKQLRETVNGLTQQVQGFMGQQQAAQVNTVEQQISEFASAANQDGSPLRPHFEAVREDVFNLIPALKAQFPSASVGQILQKAYDVAIRTNDTVSGEVRRIEEERIRSDLEKAERAKRAQLANKSIQTGAPPNGRANGAADPNDLRGTIKSLVHSWKNGEAARI